MATTKIKLPAWYEQGVHFPKFLDNGINMGNAKIFGLKNRYADYSHQQMKNVGVNRIMDTGGTDSNIPAGDKFALLKTGHISITIHSSEQDCYQAGVNYANSLGNNINAVITSELGEQLDWQYRGAGWSWEAAQPYVKQKTRAFHKGYTDTIVANRGIPRGKVLNFGEYSGIGGLQALGTPSNAHLSSMENAKKVNGATLGYFADNSYEAHNITLRVYFQSLTDLNGTFIPRHVYNILKLRKAAPDREILPFTWTEIQDLYNIDTQNHMAIHRSLKYNFTSPKGSLFIEAGVYPPTIEPYLALNMSLINFILTPGEVIWDSSDGFKNVPVDGHQKGIFGRREWTGTYNKFERTHSRIWWQPDGGSIGEYIINNIGSTPGQEGSGSFVSGAPGQPGYFDDAGVEGGFSTNPLTSTDAFYMGYWLWYQMSQYLGRIKWGKFSQNGGSSWYTPPSGTDGTYVDMYGQPNYFVNDPIVDVWNNDYPIVWTGAANGKKTVIWLNTRIKPTEYDNARVEIDSVTYNLGNLQGTIPHCFIID